MSSIGGPGGVGGPKRPGGLDRPDAAGELGGAGEVEPGERAAASELDRLAADVAAGKLTAREAVDRMVDHLAGGSQLGASERAELRELLGDLIAHDPYLARLLGGA
jgi:hypothetical protein